MFFFGRFAGVDEDKNYKIELFWYKTWKLLVIHKDKRARLHFTRVEKKNPYNDNAMGGGGGGEEIQKLFSKAAAYK